MNALTATVIASTALLAVSAVVAVSSRAADASAKAAGSEDGSGSVALVYGVRDAVRQVERPVTVKQAEEAYAREKALGQYQIRPSMVNEVNRILGEKKYHPSDALSEKLSGRMFVIYSVYWAERTRDWSAQGIARRWNGGPKGHRKSATVGYWKKVREVLDAEIQ